MEEIIKTIDSYINNVTKKIMKSSDYGTSHECMAEIDRFKKLRKLCEEKAKQLQVNQGQSR